MIRHAKVIMAALFATALAALALPLVQGARPQGASAGNARAALASVLSGVRVINAKDNRTLWTATSGKAVFSEGGGAARLTAVSIDIPAQHAKLDASGGELNLDNNTLILDGRVRSLVNGFDVKTSSVRIVPGGRLSTGGNRVVFLEKKGVKIRGRGLDAGQQKKVRLNNDVKAIFY
ncbi:MAG: hypothetical protein M0Z58_09975 [Nitrospiraceae bacterium]|nr:hypothetical protein [Nitrospiraceae bacterium]